MSVKLWLTYKCYNVRRYIRCLRNRLHGCSYFLRSWLWWKPHRAIKELWKYGYVRSWDQRVCVCSSPYRNLAKWRRKWDTWRYHRRIGYTGNNIYEPVDKTEEPVETLSRVLKQITNTTIVGVTTKRPANSGIVSTGGTKLYIHDIIDDRAEYNRISKSLTVLHDRIMGQLAKLNNRNFRTKAKPEVVVREQDLLHILLSEQQCLLESLEELNYMGDS